MDLTYYRSLLEQPRRLAAFRRALEAVVRPGDRVLEVGTGLGTYAVFAADAGAREVWAVEHDPVLHVAEDIARMNGRNTIHWVRGRVPYADVPRPADVIVYEDFGPRLLDAATWRLYRALHDGYVTPGTRFVPGRATLYAAPASVDGLVAVPQGNGRTALDWSALAPYLANLPQRDRAQVEHLLAPPQTVMEIDFAQSPEEWPSTGSVRCITDRAGSVSAIVLWHQLALATGVILDNAPGMKPGSWGHLVLPCDPPLAVQPGAEVEIELRWDPDATGAPGWLGWSVAVVGQVVRGHEMASFPAARADLIGATPDGRPRPTARGELLREILTLADGTRSAGEIAAALGVTYHAMKLEDLLARILAHVGEGLLTSEQEPS